MLIRVRSNVGVWRVDGLDADTATVDDVLKGIAQTRPDVVYELPLSRDPACQSPLQNDTATTTTISTTLKAQNLTHGSMIHCRVDASTCVNIRMADADGATNGTSQSSSSSQLQSQSQSQDDNNNTNNNNNANMKRIIDKDGSIKLVPSLEVRSAGDDRGFRRGMLPLRDMKMAWTLNEFMAMDAQFEFKLARQESSICQQVSLDSPSTNDFQSYLQRFQFQRKRFAMLYGKFITEDGDDDDNSNNNNYNNNKDKPKKKPTRVLVEAIYEPPQQPDPEAAEGWEQLDDPLEETVEQIAQLCGLTKVGWIFGHAPRQDGFVLSAAEVLMAAEFQLEAAGGIEETPFVTVKVSQQASSSSSSSSSNNNDNNNNSVSVEAFQVSQQCMAMVAEEALEIGTNPGFCNVNETFTAIQEGKESKTVNNNFFLTVVPIVQHTSETFVSQFPKLNRDLDDRTPSHDELKRQLSKSGTSGWTFLDLLSDFNLLIYLAQHSDLDLNADFPKICQSVVSGRGNNSNSNDNDKIPLDDGYKIMIASMAGLDGAY